MNVQSTNPRHLVQAQLPCIVRSMLHPTTYSSLAEGLVDLLESLIEVLRPTPSTPSGGAIVRSILRLGIGVTQDCHHNEKSPAP
jgi:hypothetical protein